MTNPLDVAGSLDKNVSAFSAVSFLLQNKRRCACTQFTPHCKWAPQKVRVHVPIHGGWKQKDEQNWRTGISPHHSATKLGTVYFWPWDCWKLSHLTTFTAPTQALHLQATQDENLGHCCLKWGKRKGSQCFCIKNIENANLFGKNAALMSRQYFWFYFKDKYTDVPLW